MMVTSHQTIGAVALALALNAPAGASVTDDERAVLEAFYQAANGDEWHRNAGWLQPGSDPCDWYGVECRFRGDLDRDLVHNVDLPGNNLSGTLDTRIFEIVHDRLDLSDNRLGGPLDELPGSPGRVDLSNNRFEGSLPTESSAVASQISGGPPSSNWYLDLSRNDFEGEVPPDWPRRVWLNLANNRLEGLPLALLEGPGFPFGEFLDLSDNRFSGELPSSLMDGNFMPHNGPGRWGGGINLCWNDWLVPESVEFRDWLRSRHVGGEFENCLSKERQPIDPSISGSWYAPSRSGEGIAAHMLDNGTMLNYFFTFDEHGRQQWLVGAQTADAHSASWRELLRTQGKFDTGLPDEDPEAIEDRGSFRIDRLDSDRVMAERVYITDETSDICLSPYPPPLNCFGNSLSDRREYERLSQLAGTTCNNGSLHPPFEQVSGAWYSPQRSGEGFLVEALPDNSAVVYWFTYKPDDSGEQAWMVGQGTLEDLGILTSPPPEHPYRATIDLHQPVGTRYGEAFDAEEIERTAWGQLELRFGPEGDGHVYFDSNLDEYGSGDYPIERIATPQLADCD